ncbi:Oidioi.mRNA.OKI2018_I69.chr2.g8416.t1.cds [Oikopleura dioica]|uniref:Oidioi.mRNA.OKI2018_I69.chr2.g8416.t1.cds n=1 Tax=Oikopleura dioica TaxID=34765 RepID=A0ABN7TFC0_OIKDI|nr:Oidioi.mRNA.OKI2018_I69.chr2.g8416.t1.cds [Oikopleura dioica]
MIEYSDIKMAIQAKSGLHGQDIYSGCCSIKCEFARTDKLNVYKNDDTTWDYSVSSQGQGQKKPCGLLGDRPILPNGAAPFTAERESVPPQVPFPVYNADGHRYPPPRGMAPLDPQAYNAGFERYPPQESCNTSVVMVYGVDDNMSCQRLFNLLCVYGNVLKVKFLRSKNNTAMVQLGDPQAVDRCCQLLTGTRLFGNLLTLAPSKQLHLVDTSSAIFDLSDGSPSFMDFSSSRNHRFTSQKMAAMNRTQKPNKSLHYYNAPMDFSEKDIQEICSKENLTTVQIKVFPPKDSKVKTSSGIVEFSNTEEAVKALVLLNHLELEGRQILKLCFSSTK